MLNTKTCSLSHENSPLCRGQVQCKGLCKYHYEREYRRSREKETNFIKYRKKYTLSEKGRATRRRISARYLSDPLNRAKKLENDARSKKRHFFRVRAYHFNYRYGSDLTARQLAAMWHRQRGKCALSGEKLTAATAHLDHIVSKFRGGTPALSNLRWLHEITNHAKWTFADEDFISFCRKVVTHAGA